MAQKEAVLPIPVSNRCGSGSPGLDDIIGGGYPRGHFYLVEGEPGTGKITLAVQFASEGLHSGIYVGVGLAGIRSRQRGGGDIRDRIEWLSHDVESVHPIEDAEFRCIPHPEGFTNLFVVGELIRPWASGPDLEAS
jgi:hypothetical protein